MKRVDLEQWRAREVARLLALVEAERRYYQEIVAVVPAGLAVLDADLSFLSANRSFQRIFDIAGARLEKLRLQDLFPSEEVTERVREVLETAAPRRNIIVQYVSKDGVTPLRLSIQPFRGWDSEAGSEILLLVEEFARMEAGPPPPEEETRQADELLENLDAIVWERDPKTLGFTYVGGGAVEILGYPVEKWLEFPDFYRAKIHPEDREWVAAFYRAALASAESRNCEYRVLTSDGDTVWLRDIVRVVRDEHGAPVRLSGISVDIGAEKLRDEQLVQTEKMAALGRLAAKVTHDCNNLLMILGGYSEELLANLPPEHPSRSDVEEILAATDRLSKITDELLAFTRRPSLSPKRFNLNFLLDSIEPRIREELGPHIELEIKTDSDLGRVNADWDKIGESILTLARHARQAMPEQGRLVIETANADLAAGAPHQEGGLPPGQYVTLVVSDSGPKLDEATRNRLFEPFFSNSRSGRELPSVYSVVSSSGGDILISDSRDGGAAFTIYLPRVQPQRETAPHPPTSVYKPSPAPARKATETVLVVEDERGIRALMRKILQKQGYTVLEASRGDEALQLAEKHEGNIHLLLTDIVMPQMNGRELAERLTTTRPDLKVLFVSGYSNEDLASEGSLPDGAEFLQKPFSLATLLDKTRSVLNGSSNYQNA